MSKFCGSGSAVANIDGFEVYLNGGVCISNLVTRGTNRGTNPFLCHAVIPRTRTHDKSRYLLNNSTQPTPGTRFPFSLNETSQNGGTSYITHAGNPGVCPTGILRASQPITKGLLGPAGTPSKVNLKPSTFVLILRSWRLLSAKFSCCLKMLGID